MYQKSRALARLLLLLVLVLISPYPKGTRASMYGGTCRAMGKRYVEVTFQILADGAKAGKSNSGTRFTQGTIKIIDAEAVGINAKCTHCSTGR